MAQEVKVKNYMSPNVIIVSPEQTIEEILKIMRETAHDGFPVVEGGNLIGIVTSRDIILRRGGKKVREVMSKEVVVTFPETNLIDAARVMFRSGFSRLPVVDENKKLIGIITNADVIRSHIERVTPEKIKKLIESLEKLYSLKTIVRLTNVKISELMPTQNRILPDEFRGREYELKRGLAEPIVVIKSGERMVLVDGHHRVLAAMKIGMKEISAYVIVLSKDIELGMEKTSRAMGLKSVEDIKIGEDAERGITEIIRGK
ncbi:MAG: CBS domain-containing protein [Euryarchaeota archaeon]|nr:CBS domain-containing protein [Euryarchaeota archaeon]